MSAVEGMGVGIIGAGGFAGFVAEVVSAHADLRIVAVTDSDRVRALRLAERWSAAVADDTDDLIGHELVEAVIIASPPATHADLAVRALRAGRHVFCEKPVALTVVDAQRISSAARNSDRTFVVDHVLRYNPILHAVARLRAGHLLGSVRRLAFENDATDDRLPPGHWFWDEGTSGGILLEHGVHFFDAAAMLLDAPAAEVQALGSRHADGRMHTVVATARHQDGALASYAHGFTHADFAERQLMRLDLGLGHVLIFGWIPVLAELDVWADDHAVSRWQSWGARGAELLEVPGVPAGPDESVSVTIEPSAASTVVAGLRGPVHRVRVRIDLGGAAAKDHYYRGAIRAGLSDLVLGARTGTIPRADITVGCQAVRVAAAATQALHDGTTHHVRMEETA